MTAESRDTTSVTRSELMALAAEVNGPVLTSGDEGFADEIATWNQALAHHPLVVVGATCAGDVQAAVRFAAVRDLPIAVVATGHGAVVPATDAVMINLRRMDQISINENARTATVGAAVEAQAMIVAAAKVDLAPISGSSPNVGVVGYTLGGGVSTTLGRTYGFASDHVLSAEVVTADGVLRRIDAETEPGLFWAIRGGKGNFGVVTSLTFRLVPMTRLYGGGLYYSAEHVHAVLAAYRAVVADAPDELTVSFAFLRLPPLPFVPEPLRGRFTVHVRVAYLGSASAGEQLIARLREAAPRVIDAVRDMPYTEIAAIHADPVDPVPAYEISTLLRDFPDEAVSALLAAAGPEAETPALMVEIRQLGGALGREAKAPSAVGHRDAKFLFFAGGVGAPEMGEAFEAPLQALVDALGPWAAGGKQANFLSGIDVAPERVAKAYEPETYARLRLVKGVYDPTNLFRINHNIPPQ